MNTKNRLPSQISTSPESKPFRWTVQGPCSRLRLRPGIAGVSARSGVHTITPYEEISAANSRNNSTTGKYQQLAVTAPYGSQPARARPTEAQTRNSKASNEQSPYEQAHFTTRQAVEFAKKKKSPISRLNPQERVKSARKSHSPAAVIARDLVCPPPRNPIPSSTVREVPSRQHRHGPRQDHEEMIYEPADGGYQYRGQHRAARQRALRVEPIVQGAGWPVFGHAEAERAWAQLLSGI